MKFECLCGTLIPDQTDALPHKAQVVADQDWFELLETIDDMVSREIVWTLTRRTRAAYQCRECGRIWINDKAGKLHSFAPDSGETPRDLFQK